RRCPPATATSTRATSSARSCRSPAAGCPGRAHDTENALAEAVRAKLTAWYTGADPAAFARIIDADVGPRTLAQVLERTRLHAGQHLRQLYAFVEWCGVTPDDRLTDERLRELGFELPE